MVAAPVASGRTATETLPPRGVNFSAFATRFATAWPTSVASCRTITRRAGRRSSSATPRRRAPAAACSIAARTLERRSPSAKCGRAIPASKRESSRMFAVSASMRSSWLPASVKSRLRVAASVVALSSSRSTKARSAASGVRSSCETSARCSCPRSRSRRSAATVPSRRPAMRLNWPRSASISTFAAISLPVGTRAERSPSPIFVAVSDRSRTGFAKRCAASEAKKIVSSSANMLTISTKLVICAMRVTRVESGCTSVISIAPTVDVPPSITTSDPLTIGSRRSPAASSTPDESMVNTASLSGVKRCCASSHEPNWMCTSARAITVARPCSSGSWSKKRS